MGTGTHHAVLKMLNKLDWGASRSAFRKNRSGWNSGDEDEFLSQIIQSGISCDAFGNEQRAEERISFFQTARNWYQQIQRPDLVGKLNDNLTAGGLTTQLFSTLRSSLERSPFAKLKKPEDQLWGSVEACADQIRLFRQKLRKQPPEQLVLAESIGLIQEDGTFLTPMAFHDALADGLLLTIKKLAHDHSWIAGDGRIIVPKRFDVGKHKAIRCLPTFRLASLWRQLERGWDKIRFFNGTLKIEKRSKITTARDETVYFFSQATEEELFLHIARQRRTNILINVSGEYERRHSSPPLRPSSNNCAKLPPHDWLNEQEFTAASLLSAVYHLDLANQSKSLAGLTLAEWLRGYALISALSRSAWSENRGVKTYKEDDLIQKLALQGVDRERGRQFINHLKLRRHSADFFDTPIMESSDGSIHLLTHLLCECDLALIVYSKVQSLVSDLNEKGHLFETHLQSEFGRLHLPCAGFPIEHNGLKLQCDVATLWGKKLFVFECKNYNLPQSEGEVLHQFCRKQDEAATQLRRLVEAIKACPDRVKTHLGCKTEWDEIVPVVINAMPWTRPELVGVFYTDYSSLVHFLSEGTAQLIMPSDGKARPTLVQQYRFWESDRPTEFDFATFLRENRILKQQRCAFVMSNVPNHIGGDAVIVIPEWANQVTPIHKQLTDGGIPTEIATRMLSMAKSVAE